MLSMSFFLLFSEGFWPSTVLSFRSSVTSSRAVYDVYLVVVFGSLSKNYWLRTFITFLYKLVKRNVMSADQATISYSHNSLLVCGGGYSRLPDMSTVDHMHILGIRASAPCHRPRSYRYHSRCAGHKHSAKLALCPASMCGLYTAQSTTFQVSASACCYLSCIRACPEAV